MCKCLFRLQDTTELRALIIPVFYLRGDIELRPKQQVGPGKLGSIDRIVRSRLLDLSPQVPAPEGGERIQDPGKDCWAGCLLTGWVGG